MSSELTPRLRRRFLGRHVAMLLDLDRKKAAAAAAFKAAYAAAPDAVKDEFARLAILGPDAALEDDGPTRATPKGAGQ